MPSDVISSERHTALHEIAHLLGGMAPSPMFIDELGQTRGSGVYQVWQCTKPSKPSSSPSLSNTYTPRFARNHPFPLYQEAIDGYGKPATFIVTPSVKAIVQDHFEYSPTHAHHSSSAHLLTLTCFTCPSPTQLPHNDWHATGGPTAGQRRSLGGKAGRLRVYELWLWLWRDVRQRPDTGIL